MAVYDGPVAFESDGVHYPATVEDAEGGLHADLSRPLRLDSETGGYRDAEPGEASHADQFHINSVDLEVGGATISVNDDDAEAVRQFLADRAADKEATP